MSEKRSLDKLPPKAKLRPVEVAAYLDISLSVVYELIQSGVLPAQKIGGQYRVPREALLDDRFDFHPEF